MLVGTLVGLLAIGWAGLAPAALAALPSYSLIGSPGLHRRVYNGVEGQQLTSINHAQEYPTKPSYMSAMGTPGMSGSDYPQDLGRGGSDISHTTQAIQRLERIQDHLKTKSADIDNRLHTDSQSRLAKGIFRADNDKYYLSDMEWMAEKVATSSGTHRAFVSVCQEAIKAVTAQPEGPSPYNAFFVMVLADEFAKAATKPETTNWVNDILRDYAAIRSDLISSHTGLFEVLQDIARVIGSIPNLDATQQLKLFIDYINDRVVGHTVVFSDFIQKALSFLLEYPNRSFDESSVNAFLEGFVNDVEMAQKRHVASLL